MALKKSQLYASLWQSCDELRGGMDASQYKDYILTLLFMKYVSDKAERNPYEVIQVPEGGSFADMVALRRRPAAQGRCFSKQQTRHRKAYPYMAKRKTMQPTRWRG